MDNSEKPKASDDLEAAWRLTRDVEYIKRREDYKKAVQSLKDAMKPKNHPDWLLDDDLIMSIPMSRPRGVWVLPEQEKTKDEFLLWLEHQIELKQQEKRELYQDGKTTLGHQLSSVCLSLENVLNNYRHFKQRAGEGE